MLRTTLSIAGSLLLVVGLLGFAPAPESIATPAPAVGQEDLFNFEHVYNFNFAAASAGNSGQQGTDLEFFTMPSMTPTFPVASRDEARWTPPPPPPPCWQARRRPWHCRPMAGSASAARCRHEPAHRCLSDLTGAAAADVRRTASGPATPRSRR